MRVPRVVMEWFIGSDDPIPAYWNSSLKRAARALLEAAEKAEKGT